MTYYEKVRTKKLYVPFDPRYSLYGNTAGNQADDFLGNKSSNIADKIMGLYQELYKRKEINTQILSEIQEEFLEALNFFFMLLSRQKRAKNIFQLCLILTQIYQIE